MGTLDRLIERRAEQLAYLFLTENGSLSVSRPQSEEDGLDFLVQIPGRSSGSAPQFGVQVKGKKASPFLNGHAAPPFLEAPGMKPNGRHARSSLPLCLFLFFVDSDASYFRWLQEPVLEKYGGLRSNETREFRPLTQETLDEIVATVRDWYAFQRKAA